MKRKFRIRDPFGEEIEIKVPEIKKSARQENLKPDSLTSKESIAAEKQSGNSLVLIGKLFVAMGLLAFTIVGSIYAAEWRGYYGFGAAFLLGCSLLWFFFTSRFSQES